MTGCFLFFTAAGFECALPDPHPERRFRRVGEEYLFIPPQAMGCSKPARDSLAHALGPQKKVLPAPEETGLAAFFFPTNRPA